MKIKNALHCVFAAVVALFSISTALAQDVVTYYHTDATGSPIAATDAYGNLLWREDYSPYGERLRQENSPRTNRMWFTGHHADDDSGLTYAGARHYDPMTGRFLSLDPVGVSPNNQFTFNRYAYAKNNPYKFIDPDGRWSAKAHDRLIDNALKNRIPAADVQAVQRASREFDKETQDPDQSHMHSMAREGQTPKDAKAMTDNFVGTAMVRARMASESGDRAAALRLFGEAMHPVMDSSSPEHTDSKGNPKVWGGMEDAIGHSPTDWIGNETSKDLTPAILNSQSQRINSAYDWVFGAEKTVK